MTNTLPNALLFTAPGCPHCPGVKASLEKLQQEGLIAELETISISDDPTRAEAHDVRSVPWLKLGEFILIGAQAPQQLRQWAKRAASGNFGDYLQNLLANGELATVENLLNQSPQHLPLLLSLLGKSDTPIQVRLGVSAIIEGLEGNAALRTILPTLIEMSRHNDHRLRSDGCYFLGLSHHSDALPALQERLNDENSEVREIAAEAIKSIQQH